MRYVIVADAISLLAEVWEDREAFWADATRDLNRCLAADLPAIVSEPDEEAAVSLAASFREAIRVTLASYPPL
jgi:hypothetical protein